MDDAYASTCNVVIAHIYRTTYKTNSILVIEAAYVAKLHVVNSMESLTFLSAVIAKAILVIELIV